MNAPDAPKTQPSSSIEHLRRRWRLALLPAAVATLFGIAYAVGRPDSWSAAQALLVRDETGGNLGRQGRFDSAEAMKTAQETVVEVSRNAAVVEAALKAIGPGSRRTAGGAWPSRADVEQIRRGVTVAAPKGAEFGRTEVIYLSVVESSRRRSIELVRALCVQLERTLSEVRNVKAQSIIAELTKTVLVAQSELAAATVQLEALERQVGSDLGELRVLSESGAGESNLRSGLNQVQNELRQVRTAHDANRERLKLLDEARREPGRLLVAPAQLFESQPALRRLKDGMVDAGLRLSTLRGKMSNDHPEVQAAKSALDEVETQLQTELAAARLSMQAELTVSESQIASLVSQAGSVETRLKRLAGIRARYANLAADVRQRAESLSKAQKELAEARASQAAALSASLITRLDEPRASDSPVGPGRATIVLGAALGGLATGVGFVIATAPVGGRRRRLSDYFGRGRRAGEQGHRDAQPAGDRRRDDQRRAEAQRVVEAEEDRAVAIR